MWRCNQLFCRHRAEEKWMNVKMVEQWSGIQRNLPAVYVRKDTKERSVKKVIKILINMKTYICDLKVYIYACILKAHSHSHSKSGGSIWAFLDSQGCKGIKWTVWFRFFQKDQIWPRCCPYHTFSTFYGRQGRHPPGPSYWRNPIWPPPGLKINHSRSTKKARIMKIPLFKEFLGQTISFLIL